MKKSIYYLIANTLSLVAAYIFMGYISGNTYPVVGLDLVVTTLKDCWTPFVIVTLVEALSIVYCVYEVTSNKSNKALSLLGCLVTIVSILYTWVSIVLVYENYKIGATVAVPYYLLGGFALTLVSVLLVPSVSKKNSNYGLVTLLCGLLLAIAGLVLQLVL